MLNCMIMESVTCMAHGATTHHQLQAFNDLRPQQFGRCSNYLSMFSVVSPKASSENVIFNLSPPHQIHYRNAWAFSGLRHSLRSGCKIADSKSSFRAYDQCCEGSQQRQENARSSLATQVGTGSENKEVDVGDGSSGTGVVIIGAGLAGLAAARQCAREGVPFLLLEASDGVGGRVRTDVHQGFLLDRGFQIFISAYPEAMQVLDYRALKLQTFYAGALVWFNGSLHRVADPFRHFTDGVASLLNPIGTAADKVIVGVVRLRAALKPVSKILSSDETTILHRLKKEGFSESMVDRFFRPFFGGIFFDRELQTTSRLFEFVFKCLALGSNTLPADGIGAIPQQLAVNLPPSSVLLNARVKELLEDEKGVVSGVLLENGRLIPAKHGVIIAAEGPEAARLLGEKLAATPSVDSPPRSTTCLYFSADACPVKEPVLLLNGSKEGIVNNMFFPTTVAPSYAPAGKTLVSVSLIGLHEGSSDAELEKRVRVELGSWFRPEVVEEWQHLRTYRIALAQPDQRPPTCLQKDARVAPGVYVCGDHRHSATFDGALVSGRQAAQALMAECNLVSN